MKTIKSLFENRFHAENVLKSLNNYQVTFTMDGWQDLDYIIRLQGENEVEVLENFAHIFPECHKDIKSINVA